MATKPTKKIEFAPSCPPLVIEPKERIKQLKVLLEYKENEFQRVNILKLIQMYEDGELGPLRVGNPIWLCNGKFYAEEPTIDEMAKNPPLWPEGIFQQMMQKAPLDTSSQMAQSAAFGSLATSSMHHIPLKMRLVPEFGGDPNNFIYVTTANDTGSNVQTILTTDLTNLNYNPSTYTGVLGFQPIGSAGGIIMRQSINIQIQVVDLLGAEMTPWLLERAVIAPAEAERLSGAAMRNHLLFCHSTWKQFPICGREEEWNCQSASCSLAQ